MYRLSCSKPALADKAAQMVKKSRRVQQMLLLLAVLGTSMTIGDGVMKATASGVSPCGKILKFEQIEANVSLQSVDQQLLSPGSCHCFLP